MILSIKTFLFTIFANFIASKTQTTKIRLKLYFQIGEKVTPKRHGNVGKINIEFERDNKVEKYSKTLNQKNDFWGKLETSTEIFADRKI